MEEVEDGTIAAAAADTKEEVVVAVDILRRVVEVVNKKN